MLNIQTERKIVSYDSKLSSNDDVDDVFKLVATLDVLMLCYVTDCNRPVLASFFNQIFNFVQFLQSSA